VADEWYQNSEDGNITISQDNKIKLQIQRIWRHTGFGYLEAIQRLVQAKGLV
jgi:hypothetical protein